MGPGPLIAIDVTLLYLLLGPLVLFGIYVFFDSLDRTSHQGKEKPSQKDPSLWTDTEIRSYMDQE